MIFLNTGVKTQNVEFCEVKLTNGKIEEIVNETFDYNTIVTKNYSLFANKYKQTEKIDFGDVELKKLIDICNFLPTTKHTSSIGQQTGIYRFYNSSQTDLLYLDTFEVNEESVIIGNGGSICVHYDTKFTPSKHVTVCTKKETDIDLKYIYYYLLINVDKLKQLNAGSTIQWLNKTNIGNLEIPVPSVQVQELIVKKLDVISNNIIRSQSMINDYKEIIKNYIDCETKLNIEIKKLENICTFETKSQKLKASDGQNEGKYRFFTSSQDKILFSDICEFKNKHIILGRGGNPSIHIASNFSISHDDCYVLSSDSLEFIYQYLNSNKHILAEGFTGSTIKHISKAFINEIKLPIPSKEKQKEIDKFCVNIVNIIDQIEKQTKLNKILMKSIIDTYLQNNNDDCAITDIVISEENTQDDEEITVKKEKSIKKTQSPKMTEVEKKPTKKKTITHVEEQIEVKWDLKILKTMKMYKDKENPENAKVLTKLRNDNNIPKKLFYSKMNELRAAQTKTK